MIKIYNTLTKKKEVFRPIEEGKVKMYVCGPTVYNFIHIGNARPYIMFDVVRRYLEYRGYDVNYVQNFTDIDDKIIKKSKEEKVSAKAIAEKYIHEIFVDADGLGVKRATTHPRVTQEIPEIIQMIQTLIEKGYAYEVKGTVYFGTKRFENYGKLSKKKQEDLEAGSRVQVDNDKENPMDFVLWKPKKEGELSWSSPWGEGRPGWHIECSCMAKKYLGDSIDIHAGGTDLIFPHHENEIAQSEAANGKRFANYWMHNAFLNINNKKMSKSKGNFYTVRELSELFTYDVIRFFMINAHYRSPLNFSESLMEAAANGLERIQTAYYHLTDLLKRTSHDKIKEEEVAIEKALNDYRLKFEEAMDDDFNTADAVAVIFEIIKLTNKTTTIDSSSSLIQLCLDLLDRLGGLLGITLKKKQELLDNEIELLIEKRQQARKNKDFTLADEIRDQLKKQGILLEDTREGVRFKRI